MPSSAKSICDDYKNLFKNSEKSLGIFFNLFRKTKNMLPSICPFCKIKVKDEKTKHSHRESCWRFHVIYIAKCDILSKISQAKISGDSIDKLLLESYRKMFSKLDKTIEFEASKWELKYFKSLKSSLSINLGDFEFIKPITKGGYGQIFLIKDKYTGKLMCAKVISISEAIQRSCIASYVSERNLLLRCDSNQII